MYEPKFAHGPVSVKFTKALRRAVLKINSPEELEEFALKIHDAVLVARNDDDGLEAAIRVIEE